MSQADPGSFRSSAVDELTGVWDRRAGKAALQEQLDVGGPLAVALLDVNGMGERNAREGHRAGDAYLTGVAQALVRALGERGWVFRLSGDEFVAVLPGGTGAEAARCMDLALEELEPAGEAFCYGTREVREGESITLEALLANADEKLYEQKRQLHIRRAAEQLERQDPAVEPEAFDYDEKLLYDALVQSTDDYIYICNMKTGVFRYPQAMVEEFDLPGQVVANAAAVWGAKVHKHDKRAFLESNQDIADGRTDCHCVEYRAQNRNGEWLWMRCRGRVERDEHGQPTLFAGFITNLGKKNRTDHQTGLFNKIAFQDEAQRLLGTGSSVVLLLFGIDDLKRINSLFDREFGDEVIRIVSQKVQSMLPPNAQVFRLDGDEFGVLCRGGGRQEAEGLFRSVQDSLSARQTYDGKHFFCTLSCGCALAPEGGLDFLTLFKYASYALDYAKHRGKDRLEFFAPDILPHMERRMELTELLRESMEQDYQGFEMWYQPVFHRDRTLDGAEALCRWSCEKYGSVPPSEFIPLLEESGLILKAGRWILAQAIQACARFLRLCPDFVMSINLSCLQLEDRGLAQYIVDTLDRWGVPPAHIILELTESYLAANLERLEGLLGEFRARGIRVAMDDFGTGYSSLYLLKHAPVDVVKIDRAFVQGIQASAFDRSFIRLVVELCHTVGIQVCLEGVETEEEFQAAAPSQIDFIQGFLLGRPCPPQALEENYGKEHTPQ